MANEMTQTQQGGSLTTIKAWLQNDQFKGAIAQALPKHVTPDRFLRVAITAVTKTPKLAQCEQASFLNSLLTLSQLGLEPDGRRAHLIPFENRKRGVVECQLIVDYKGMVELVMRSGLVSYIHADVVKEHDEFIHDKGQLISHRIDFKSPRGKPYAFYALCKMKDGTEKCEVMTLEEVEAIRQRSRASSNGPWVTDFNEMGKKTVFKRLSKWLPFSPEIREAIEVDDDQYEASAYVAPTATVQHGTKSDQLADMLTAKFEGRPVEETTTFASDAEPTDTVYEGPQESAEPTPPPSAGGQAGSAAEVPPTPGPPKKQKATTPPAPTTHDESKMWLESIMRAKTVADVESLEAAFGDYGLSAETLHMLQRSAKSKKAQIEREAGKQ